MRTLMLPYYDDGKTYTPKVTPGYMSDAREYTNILYYSYFHDENAHAAYNFYLYTMLVK